MSRFGKYAILATLLLPSIALAATFSRPLALGMSGSDVTSLQQILQTDGYLSVAPTGYFGPLTQAAVEEYQSAKGIVSSGSPETTGYGDVGPKTLASLNGGTTNSKAALIASLEAELKLLEAQIAAILAAQQVGPTGGGSIVTGIGGGGGAGASNSNTSSQTQTSTTPVASGGGGGGGSSAVSPGGGGGSSQPSQTSSSSATFIQAPGPSQTLFDNPYYTCVRNFYVATTGSDSNPGTLASPWLTIAHADTASRQAGDCINVEPGTYTAFNNALHYGGDAATPTGYIVYRCTQLDACHITQSDFNGEIAAGNNRGGFYPNYLIFDGFDLTGSNPAQPDDTGIACAGPNNSQNSSNGCHHWWIINNIIANHGQGGVGNEDTEFWYVVHNDIVQNSHMPCMGWYGSGIGLVVAEAVPGYVKTADDVNANNNAALNMMGVQGPDFPFNNVIAWNIVGNNYQGCQASYATDGNGIIIDTFLAGGTNSTLSEGRTVDYPNRSLVAFNIVYNSGGGGIHVFSSAFTTVANNSVYNNGLDPYQNGWQRANLDISGGSNTANGFGAGTDNFFNNIAVAVPAGACDGVNGATNTNNLGSQVPFSVGGDGTHADGVWNSPGHNITYTIGTSCHLTPDASTGNSIYQSPPNVNWDCTANKCNMNPQWVGVGTVAAGDETTAPSPINFALLSTSPAISYGVTKSYLSPQSVDVGACYHSLTNCGAVNASGGTTAASTTPTSNPAPDTTPPVVTITAPSGQLPSGTAQVSLAVTTNESATCAWANTAGVAFASMSPFSSTGGISHTTAITGLADGSTYTVYVKCKDTSGNISTDSSASFSIAASSTGSTLSNGLVGYWSLDTNDISSTTVTDLSGNGNTGVIFGGPASVPGKLGQALSLSSPNQGINVGHGTSLDLTGPFSISFWTFPTTTPAQAGYSFFQKAPTYLQRGFVSWYGYYTAEPVCGLANGSASAEVRSSVNMNINQWNHVVCVYDGTHFMVYLNGTQTGSVASSVNPGDSATDNLSFGAGGSAGNDNNEGGGPIDEIRVYNRALTPTEVSQLAAGQQ